MPKNLSTVGGATELRFGKNCREDQHNNSVVINASNDKIDATKAGGFYLTPLELSTEFASDGTDATTNTFVAYNQSTKQLFRTQVPISITGISSAGSGAEGDLNVNGNLYVTGNVTSIGTVANIHVTNSQFKDGLIEIGTNNTDLATFDLGHIYNRPVGSSNVAVCYDASATELIIAYTDSSAAAEVGAASSHQVNPTNETMNVHVYGKLFTESNVGVANTTPDHTFSVGEKCFIEADGNHDNVLDVRGNTTIEGAIITNTGGVTKKTYSDKNTIASGTTAAGAALTLTFTRHPFYAKIVAQLIDNNDNEVSTMLIDVAGGERGGDANPLDLALGPISIFGTSQSSNPWSSTVSVTPTTMVLTPSAGFNTGAGSYSIFVEYISPNPAGALTSINSVNFGY